MADRIFAPDARAISQGRLAIEGDEAHHLCRVRRVGFGERVEVFDGEGFGTLAEVVAIDRRRVELQAVGDPLPDRLAPVSLTLASAFPKGDRADWLVEKAAELGVARFVPVVTRRTVVDPRLAKLDRLRRASIEAAKQCGRNRVMKIDPPVAWAEFLRSTADPIKFIAHPDGLPFARWAAPKLGSAVALAIGPEGGFTDDELAEAVAKGWIAIGLGATILRIETAGLVASARVLAMAEEETSNTTEGGAG